MLTGRRAFERPTTAETLSAIIREEPPAIAQLNPAVPPPVRWIVERCLAKDPQERYVLTRDLARELASVREHLSELPASRRGRRSRRAAGDVTLAVMPVVNISGSPRQEPLADAMTDALITALTRCPGVRVMSRTSSMTYKGQRSSLPDIADELGIDWIVLASLAKANSEIRITAQLVDAENDENRWAQSYTRRSRNVLSMQVEIGNAIAQAVSVMVTAPSLGAAAGNEAAAPRHDADDDRFGDVRRSRLS
jgi:TolB-like protein